MSNAGYSKLLANELIVPDPGAHCVAATTDWLIVALGSARDRTESEFRELVHHGGLNAEKAWLEPSGSEGRIDTAVPV